MDVFSEIIVAAVEKAKNAVVKIDKYTPIGVMKDLPEPVQDLFFQATD